MDIKNIYKQVEEYIRENYGTGIWCYTDFFLDEKGFAYFQEQVKSDNGITDDMCDDEIVEHICQCLSESETINMFQQTALSVRG